MLLYSNIFWGVELICYQVLGLCRILVLYYFMYITIYEQSNLLWTLILAPL